MARHGTRAILFDLDGVLIDSLDAQIEAWTWWCGVHGLDPGPFLAAHGLTGPDKIGRYAPHLDVVAEAAQVTEYEVAHTAGVRAAPGAARVWGLGIPFTIVTSAAAALAQARLSTAGLPIPTHLVSADSVARGKPDPEPYLTGAARLGVPPEDCVVVEDAPAGVQSGLAAGMHVVALTTTVGQEELSAAHVVLPSLLAFIERVGAAHTASSIDETFADRRIK